MNKEQVLHDLSLLYAKIKFETFEQGIGDYNIDKLLEYYNEGKLLLSKSSNFEKMQ